MPRRNNDSLASVLLVAPWWVSAGLGVLAVIALKWGLPVYLAKKQVAHGLLHVGERRWMEPQISPMGAGRGESNKL